MIIVISHLDLTGSGYMNIALGLCSELSARGKEVFVMGIGNQGDEHNWPFSILPIDKNMWMQHVTAAVGNLIKMGNNGVLGDGNKVEAIITALDIPWQLRLEKSFPEDVPYIGIFPIEDGPLSQTWAMELSANDGNLIISKYGLDVMDEAGLEGEYIPIGIDANAWAKPAEEVRQKFRESMGFDEDEYVILTVADNQERKNLSAAIRIIAEARKTHEKITWILVTRQNALIGWNLKDLTLQYDMADKTIVMERGLPFKDLWRLYVMADLFLLTSKAEGLCMPVIEAQSTGTLTLTSHCAAFLEHAYEDVSKRKFRKTKDYRGERGFTIPIEFQTQDVFGNSNRSYVDIEAGTEQLLSIIKMWQKGDKSLGVTVDKAREYAAAREIRLGADVLNKMLDELLRDFAFAKVSQIAQDHHPVQPHVVEEGE